MDPAFLILAVLSVVCIVVGLYLILHGRKKHKRKAKPKPIVNVKDEESVRSLISIAEKLEQKKL